MYYNVQDYLKFFIYFVINQSGGNRRGVFFFFLIYNLKLNEYIKPPQNFHIINDTKTCTKVSISPLA